MRWYGYVLGAIIVLYFHGPNMRPYLSAVLRMSILAFIRVKLRTLTDRHPLEPDVVSFST